ncbi:MAG: peroxidase-related enzyme [Acidimicrobiales bacterium]
MSDVDKPISRYPVPSLDELPDDIREMITAVADKSGFVPNVFLALAHRPAEFRAFMGLHDALMDPERLEGADARESGLSKAEREMIVVVTSAQNECLYCVVAHGAILRIRAKSPTISDQVATNWRHADLTDRERAICAFANRVAMEPATLADEHHAELRTHGLSDEDIWDVGAIASFFALSNRMAHLTQMRANDEFYSMGR